MLFYFRNKDGSTSRWELWLKARVPKLMELVDDTKILRKDGQHKGKVVSKGCQGQAQNGRILHKMAVEMTGTDPGTWFRKRNRPQGWSWYWVRYIECSDRAHTLVSGLTSFHTLDKLFVTLTSTSHLLPTHHSTNQLFQHKGKIGLATPTGLSRFNKVAIKRENMTKAPQLQITSLLSVLLWLPFLSHVHASSCPHHLFASAPLQWLFSLPFCWLHLHCGACCSFILFTSMCTCVSGGVNGGRSVGETRRNPIMKEHAFMIQAQRRGEAEALWRWKQQVDSQVHGHLQASCWGFWFKE